MDMKRFFLYAIAIAALALAGCGGNGGGMPIVDNGNGNGNGNGGTCDADQTGNYPDCVDPVTGRTAPAMELVYGIVTANDKDHSATNPAEYNDPKRPGKEVDAEGREGDVVLVGSLSTDADTANQNLVRVKTDGTIGDVSIATVDTNSDGVETFTGATKLTMTEDMAPSVGRFASGSVHSRTHMGVTDTVYAYETRNAPGPQAWNTLYPVTNTPADGVNEVSLNEPESTTVQKFNVLEFVTNGADNNVMESAKKFAGDMFPSSASQTNTYYANQAYDDIPTKDRGTTDVRGRTFDGMFHGIPGEYVCEATAATGCMAGTNNRGQIVTLVGAWTFTPSNLDIGVTGHMVQGVVNDADYLTFGYWVQKDEDEDETTIGVSTFASGTPLTTTYLADWANLEGTADYEGKAVGKFVKKTLASDGMATISDGGTFTADANLKAYFGGSAISFNDSFTVGGTIDDFRNDDGDMIDSNWSVKLKASFGTDSTNNGTKDTLTSDFKGTTSASGPAGDWGGSFYGTPMNSDGTEDVPSATNTDAYPTSVAGEFDAHFSNGHTLGAFGATR